MARSAPLDSHVLQRYALLVEVWEPEGGQTIAADGVAADRCARHAPSRARLQSKLELALRQSAVDDRYKEAISCGLLPYNLTNQLLRIINASAMTNFNVRLPGLPMRVVQCDGQNVRPVDTDEFQIGIAETYDVIVQPTEARLREKLCPQT